LEFCPKLSYVILNIIVDIQRKAKVKNEPDRYKQGKVIR